MVANVPDNKYKRIKRLSLPFCEMTGVTPEQKKTDHKALEFMAWKKHRKESKTFTMKKFNNYFENQDRINSRR